MLKSTKWVSMLIAGLMLAATPAFAGDDKPAPTAKKPAEPAADADKDTKPPASSDAAADMKAGTGVNKKKKEIVGEAETFTAGTKVWVWSSVTGAKGTTVKHVWKKDDKVVWEKEFEATSGRYRTWTRRNVKAGTYTVETQTEDGTVLGTVTFTVS
jgi:hypothetical protein